MTESLNPTLDWHPPSPERKAPNQPYRFFAQLGVADPKDLNLELKPKSRAWARFYFLDQGQEGACTGFGLAHCLGIGYRPWQVRDTDAFLLYKWARENDEWAGENYEGSSVQGAMDGARKHGVINGYWHIETPDEFIAAVGRYGAVECGTYWKSGMWRPDPKNIVHNTGGSEGGHAYSVGAVNLGAKLARIDNSWGRNKWGVNGSAWIALDELFSLIFDEGGECILPRKKLYVPGAFAR